MHELPAPSTTEARFAWLALALAIAATCAYALVAEWPLGTHGDELKKTRFVLSGQQDFLHPIGMLQLARIANGVASFTEPVRVLELGRGLAAAFGGLLVFATFLLARSVAAPLAALAVAAAVAVCPLVAVHATFFKEDIFLAPMLVLAIAALIGLVQRPSRARSAALGLAIGAAASAKYIGAIALPYALLVIFVAMRAEWRERLRHAAIATAVAAATIAAINAPVFRELATFRRGLGFELAHATGGHDVRLPLDVTYGVLHLVRSLAPGLGLPLLAIGLAGLLAPFVCRAQRRPLAIVLGIALIWYAVHELSPLKPFPDFERYMVPLAPLLLVPGAALLANVAGRALPRRAALVAALLIAIAAVPALLRSFAILDAARIDPRAVIPEIAASLGPNACFDRYASFDHVEIEAAALDPFVTNALPPTLVTSNFLVDRFLVYGRHGAQPATVAQARNFYEQILARPQLVISNGGPPYAFLNPVLHVVAVDGDAERLQAVAAAIERAEPRLSVEAR